MKFPRLPSSIRMGSSTRTSRRGVRSSVSYFGSSLSVANARLRKVFVVSKGLIPMGTASYGTNRPTEKGEEPLTHVARNRTHVRGLAGRGTGEGASAPGLRLSTASKGVRRHRAGDRLELRYGAIGLRERQRIEGPRVHAGEALAVRRFVAERELSLRGARGVDRLLSLREERELHLRPTVVHEAMRPVGDRDELRAGQRLARPFCPRTRRCGIERAADDERRDVGRYGLPDA